MLLSAISDFFKFKMAASIVVVSCWSKYDQVQFLRELSTHGVRAQFSCSENFKASIDQFQGVLYFTKNDSTLDKAVGEYIWSSHKWLIVGEKVPSAMKEVRYDADITLLKAEEISDDLISTEKDSTSGSFYFDDIYVHPIDGRSAHPWAVWTKKRRLQLNYENERILRRNDLRTYPLTISTPLSHYVHGNYNGSFRDYTLDESKSALDSALSCAFAGADLLTNAIHATPVLTPVPLWYPKEDNRSMVHAVATGQADISGGALQLQHDQLQILDYIMPLWPFRAGFTYLAERNTNQNLFMMPFSEGVWWCCLITSLIIAAVQRLTAETRLEKEGALNTVMATFLQQDASAVPAGTSGRLTFTALSLWAMMLYAYYSSAIVSVLMNTRPNGPHSLRELADSKYAIAAEDCDYARTMFDFESDRPDLEYLKKKKKTVNLYQTMQRGAEMLRGGNTAYHTEFNQIYPNLMTLSDAQVCKLSYIDTVPETLTWIVAPKRSQFTNVLRVAGAKIQERGLAKRLIKRWQARPAPCRVAVVVESITIDDVAALIWISLSGVLLSLVLLAAEILHARLRSLLRPVTM